MISRFSCFERVFLLNDTNSTRYYNKKYFTDKFDYLPDPYLPIEHISEINIRTEYDIKKNKKILLHFGGMSKRKGTLDILNSILLLKDEIASNFCFIFAGRVYDDIKREFYDKINEIGNRCQVLIFDSFCEYNFLGILCKNSDFILMPYHITSQSSGVMAYAAQFEKPVIAPSSGLLGRIVEDYKLGILLPEINPEIIASCLSSKMFSSYRHNKNCSREYLANNTIEKFVEIFFLKL